jgi:hypothetical protein
MEVSIMASNYLPQISSVALSVASAAEDHVSVAQILRAFASLPEDDEGLFPMRELRAALADPERITPALLALLDQTPERVNELMGQRLDEDDSHDLSLSIAMYILAAFEEPRAFRKILRFFHRNQPDDGLLSGEMAHYVVGDLITMDLSAILAATFDGDIGPLLDVITDTRCDEFVRVTCVDTLFCLVAADKLPRDEAIAYLGSLAERLPKDPEQGIFWLFFTEIAARFASERLRPILKALFDQDLIDSREMTWENVEADYGIPWAKYVAKHYTPEHLTNLVEHLPKNVFWSWPYGLPPGESSAGRGLADADEDVIRRLVEKFEAAQWSPQMPVRRSETKVGRNDPCSCGSGKKYKKCCLE